MAAVLEGRHGYHAADVAIFLAEVMQGKGDEARARAWLAVGRRVHRRMLARIRAE